MPAKDGTLNRRLLEPDEEPAPTGYSFRLSDALSLNRARIGPEEGRKKAFDAETGARRVRLVDYDGTAPKRTSWFAEAASTVYPWTALVLVLGTVYVAADWATNRFQQQSAEDAVAILITRPSIPPRPPPPPSPPPSPPTPPLPPPLPHRRLAAAAQPSTAAALAAAAALAGPLHRSTTPGSP